MQKKYLIIALLFSTLIVPSLALADAGIIPLVAVVFFNPFYTLIISVAVLIVVILIESIFMKLTLKTNYSRVLVSTTIANIISTIIGAAVYFGIIYLLAFMGLGLVASIIAIPAGFENINIQIILILIESAIAFFLSVLIEYFFQKLFLKGLNRRDIKRGTWMANAASYILLVGFILLALMIWENNQYSEYNAQMAKNTRIAQGLEKQERQVTNSDKLYQQALMALDVSYCSQTNIKDLCEKEISAIKNNDITYCDSLADNEFNQIRCYERFAEMKNDTSVCERLQSGYVNECQQLQDIIKVQDLTKPYYQ